MAGPALTPSNGAMPENEALRARLAEAESKLVHTESQLAEAQEVISAIRSGDVDALVVSSPEGDQVFTLKGAEYAYRALVEAMNEGAATLGADGIVHYCNQRLAGLLGIPLEQIVGSPAANLVAHQAKHSFEAVLAQSRSGEPCNTELDFLSVDSTHIPVYVSLRQMAAVEPPALCMVVTDLTERKKRDELLAAGRLSTSILDSAAEAIAVCDETGKIISANEALENLCGFNPKFQAFESALPLELRAESTGPEKHFSISDALRGGTLRAREVRLVSNRVHPVSLLLTASAIKSSAGVVGCVLTMTDITEKKKAEAALLQSEKLASVGRMASTIAHEINNPLETIGQAIYLALNDPGISQNGKSYLDLAVQELDRVTHITRQTLAFHRDSKTPKLIDLRETVDSILKLFAARLESRGVAVEKRYPEEVERIGSFGGEIQQIVSNLLSNSMDAISGCGKIQLRLSRSIGRNGARLVRFAIADTGSGIAPEHLKKIFEPFFTTKEVVGTGLGLWVTKQIVEKHGAAIQVRSKLGRGTVFSISFPVSAQNARKQSDK
jgi:PAS domain S-box-containing protein